MGRGNKPVPPGAKLTIAFDRNEYVLGENVLLQFILENTGQEPFTADFGGDYRGADRSLRFKVTARDPQGHVAPEPDSNPPCFGGLGFGKKLMPGEKLVISLPMMRYCQIDQPGSYTIRATHDFGWKDGVLKIPVAETSVTFRMPNAQEAEQIVEQMEKLPDNDSSATFGKKSSDFADFRCLRYPVYLKPLLGRAKSGDLRALEGVGHIPSPEATMALIDLANGTDAPRSLPAAQLLNDRLPDPDFSGKLPARGPFNIYDTAARKQLATQSWDPAFADKVRLLAHRFLMRPENDAVSSGAFMIQAVGTTEDAPAIFSALNHAAEMPAAINPRRDPKDDVLDFPAPIPELLRASAMLYARGYDPKGHLSGNGEFLAYFSNWTKDTPERPAEWLNLVDVYGANGTYPVREAALKSIPVPLPDSCVKFVHRGLADQDLGVCMTACTIAGKSGRKEFLKPLLEIVATENEEWVLREAGNSALSLGGGYDLLETWTDRLTDENLFPLALDGLQTVLEGLPGGNSGRTDLTRAERLALRDAWKKFLADHAEELRSGKKFKYSDPAITSALFGRARAWQFPDGTDWPMSSEAQSHRPPDATP